MTAKFIILSSILFIAFSKSALSDNHQIVTSNALPYSIEGQEKKGILVEIIKLIEKNIGTNNIPSIYPWPRAQMLAQRNDDYIIFPLARTAGRENQYTWIVDVMPLDFVFASIDAEINDLEQAKKLKAVTVRDGTPFAKFLKQRNFKNLKWSASEPCKHLKLLNYGRVDAWFGSKQMIKYSIRMCEDVSFYKNIKISEPFASKRIYIAGSKNLDQNIVSAYEKAFSVLKNEGVIDKIINDYQ